MTTIRFDEFTPNRQPDIIGKYSITIDASTYNKLPEFPIYFNENSVVKIGIFRDYVRNANMKNIPQYPELLIENTNHDKYHIVYLKNENIWIVLKLNSFTSDYYSTVSATTFYPEIVYRINNNTLHFINKYYS